MSSHNRLGAGIMCVPGQAVSGSWGCEGGQTTPRVRPAPSKLIATGRIQEQMGSGINCRIVATSL